MTRVGALMLESAERVSIWRYRSISATADLGLDAERSRRPQYSRKRSSLATLGANMPRATGPPHSATMILLMPSRSALAIPMS